MRGANCQPPAYYYKNRHSGSSLYYVGTYTYSGTTMACTTTVQLRALWLKAPTGYHAFRQAALQLQVPSPPVKGACGEDLYRGFCLAWPSRVGGESWSSGLAANMISNDGWRPSAHATQVRRSSRGESGRKSFDLLGSTPRA